MRLAEQLVFAVQSLAALRARTALIVLAMAIGTAGVVLLTWLGEAGRRYVTDQFAQLGTNLVIVLPGRSETTGGAPPMFGETARDLTLDDALALRRSEHVARLAPIVAGSVAVAFGNREREATVLGSTAELLPVRHLSLAAGQFLPAGDPRRGGAECVLGGTLVRELFGAASPLGAWVRLGDRRFRVTGTLASAGRSLGNDLDEMVVIPVASAMALFDSEGLFRLLVEARDRDAVARTVADCERILRTRHDGELDVTVITQASVLSTFDGILRALTWAIAGIAAISLVVAGILIMNVMVIAVSQRRAEVGLLKALGAAAPVVRTLFLWEALLLAVAGAGCGLALASAVRAAAAAFVPELRTGLPGAAVAAAALVALGIGVAFGTAPAARAARLDPVLALARR
ncbi:MAG: ABC transporter permease [Planctomycetes bacterium]|nr:ABC transporter permease [Planctomycetota bacterium]